jgi:hypothetical protein
VDAASRTVAAPAGAAKPAAKCSKASPSRIPGMLHPNHLPPAPLSATLDFASGSSTTTGEIWEATEQVEGEAMEQVEGEASEQRGSRSTADEGPRASGEGPLVGVAPPQQPVRLAYQPPASSTLLSEQTSHQQPASSTLLSEQTSTSHQPPANRTGCKPAATSRSTAGGIQAWGGARRGGSSRTISAACRVGRVEGGLEPAASTSASMLVELARGGGRRAAWGWS